MKSLTVRTPFLFWFGGATLVGTLALVIAWGNWLSMFLLSTLFGGLGAALFFMSARIVGDETGLTIERPRRSRQAIDRPGKLVWGCLPGSSRVYSACGADLRSRAKEDDSE